MPLVPVWVDMSDGDQRNAMRIEKLFQTIHLVSFANKQAAARRAARSNSPTTALNGKRDEPLLTATDSIGDGTVSSLCQIPLERHIVKEYFADVLAAGTSVAGAADSFYDPLTNVEQVPPRCSATSPVNTCVDTCSCVGYTATVDKLH